jgi:tol-pal system protein YbgF
MPLIVWGAMRFGPRGASLLSLVTSGVAIAATASQRGPFYQQDIQESVRLLWAFMAVVGGTAACLSSAAAESRRVQANLKQNRDRYQLLVEGSGVLAWEADPLTTQFTYVSGEPSALLGYSPKRWCEPGFWKDTIHSEDRDATIDACSTKTRQGLDHTLEYRMVAADGSVRWVHDLISVASPDTAARTSAATPRLLRGLMIDVTERKAYDSALAVFRSGEFRAAQNAFSQFLLAYPQSAYGPAAQYWIGSSQYAQKDNKGAIASLQSFVQKYPDNPRVPEALLVVGTALAETGDRKGAADTFKALNQQFPESPAAATARERLAALAPAPATGTKR